MDFWSEFGYVWNNYNQTLLSGVGNTLLVALTGTLFGLLIGIIIGVIRTVPQSKNAVVRVLQKILNGILIVYIEVFRGTPMIVQAMVFKYGFLILFGFNAEAIVLGIIIVSINTGAYMAEIVRGGIISIDKGQFEGAQSVGMNHFQTMFHVIIPQVLRNILPSVTNEFIINIKDTSVLNVINVMELFFMAKTVGGMSLDYLQTYIIASLMYLVMTLSISLLLRFIERLLKGKDNFTIFGSQSDPSAEIKVTESK